MPKIILTGGGTAGHVTPNIALLPRLKEEGFEILYVGSYDGIEKKLIHDVKEGALVEVAFEQDMTLQGGEYLLSISCTGFENGELKAYHRLYDLLNITVISDKNTVGFYDMESDVTIREIKAS